MLSERDIVLLLERTRYDLDGWTEANPHTRKLAGALVPTEPDISIRARIRISLRAKVHALETVLGITSDLEALEREDHRDLQRIGDDAVAQERPA